MEMTAITPAKINATYNAVSTSVGLDHATMLATAMTASQTFTNDGRTFLYVTNGAGSSPLIVTVNNVALCDHGFDHDVVFTVPVASGRMVGPFPVGWFGSTVTVTSTGGESGKTCAVFELPAISPGGS
jgi:hypothetical protein